MAEKEEDGNDGMLGELREMAQMLQEMISQGVDSDHDDGQGGENKVNSDEMSNHQLAGLSTTYNVLAAYYKSDIANLETRNVPVSSGEAVPFSPEPSSSDLTNVEIKRMPISSAKEAPLLRPPHTRMLSLSGLSLKPIKNDDSVHEKSTAMREQLGESDLASKYNLPSDEEVTNPIDYTSSDYDVVRNQLQEHFSLLFIANDVDSKELSKIDSSSSDHLKAEQAQYETHDFTFDVKQSVNPAQAPPQPILQRQNAMRQQRYTRELDPGYSVSSLNQPMTTRESITTTSSSHGHKPSISMTKALKTATDFVPKRNQQAMNPHYSQCQVPSGQYYGSNTTNSPYLPPPSAAAAFQQLGGSNNNTLAHYDNMMTSPYQRPEQNESYYMPDQLAASVDPYAYGSVNLFGMSSDNAANLRFGYEGGVSRNHLPSTQHQRGDSNVWPPSTRPSRQLQQLRSEIFATHQNQQNDRSHDLSDQTKQRLWPRDN